MSDLGNARRRLTTLLQASDIAEVVSKDPARVVQYMREWLLAYKAWELTDTDFYEIWRDKRMFVRSIGASDSNYATLQVKKPSLEAWKKDGWASAAGEDVPTRDIIGVAYNTGRDGLLKRLDPDKFLNRGTGPTKTKYAEGLLDVSGTVLRPDKKISMQLHAKPMKDHWQCFVPLGKEKDQELLLLVKDKLTQLQIVLGTTHSGFNQIRAQYKQICARVTRLKLAFETDLALGFVAIPDLGGGTAKYKYLPKTAPKYSMNNQTPGLANTTPTFNAELQALLRNNVSRYKSVVGIAIKNEVRISIRNHENPTWPMFVKWTGTNREDVAGRWEVNTYNQNAWSASGLHIRNLLG